MRRFLLALAFALVAFEKAPAEDRPSALSIESKFEEGNSYALIVRFHNNLSEDAALVQVDCTFFDEDEIAIDVINHTFAYVPVNDTVYAKLVSKRNALINTFSCRYNYFRPDAFSNDPGLGD